jgi:hypothetical protein
MDLRRARFAAFAARFAAKTAAERWRDVLVSSQGVLSRLINNYQYSPQNYQYSQIRGPRRYPNNKRRQSGRAGAERNDVGRFRL